MSAIVIAAIVLGAIGIIGATILYVVAKKFYVYEDPRIAEVEALLPGANCGSCGRSGCHDFAVACVGASTLDGLNCPGAGDKAMKCIANLLGLAPVSSKSMVAVLRCNGYCSNRPITSQYDGPRSCAILSTLGTGTTDCAFGCLGQGDCVDVCRWNAIHIDPVTGLPVIDSDLCTGCGACMRACPRHIIELRPKGPRGMRVWVACVNHDRGGKAMKVCRTACIGCGKCVKACAHDAIKLDGNLAYIDYDKCRLCRKCVLECPTNAIHDVGFPISAADMAALKAAKQKPSSN